MLVAIRAVTFGEVYESEVTCLHCGELYEIKVDLLKDIPQKKIDRSEVTFKVTGRHGNVYRVSDAYGATRFVGNAIGSLTYLLRTRSAKNTEINLRYCFPAMREARRKTLAQQSLKHTGRLLAEAGITFNWPEEKLKALITGVDGFAPLQQALDEHRGILVLAPHFGNWELTGLIAPVFGVPEPCPFGRRRCWTAC